VGEREKGRKGEKRGKESGGQRESGVSLIRLSPERAKYK
jgi:hypothetical protein